MIHDLGKKEVIVNKIGCHHSELVEWVNNNEIINNFIGCVEVTKEFLNTQVPEVFPDSQIHDFEIITETEEIPSIDEDGNEITITKEYEKKNYLYETTTDEFGEEIESPLMRQMYWYEYGGQISADNFVETINDKYILWIGKRELPYGNRFTKVLSDEFYEWVNYFGIENVHTKSETYNLIKRPSLEE